MPKLKNLTADDVKAVLTDADDLIQRIWEIADMIEKGYVDRLPDIAEQARSVNSLAMAASTLTGRLLTKAEMQKRDDEIERLKAKA